MGEILHFFKLLAEGNSIDDIFCMIPKILKTTSRSIIWQYQFGENQFIVKLQIIRWHY